MRSHNTTAQSIFNGTSAHLAIGLLACLILSQSLMAEDKWWPSKWGAKDRLGAFNLLSPEKTLAATKLVTTGKSYALGINSGPDTPAGADLTPRSFSLSVVQPG